LVLLTVLLSHLRFSLLPWIFTIYLTSAPGIIRQNYGLFMMFSRASQRAQIAENTRQAFIRRLFFRMQFLFLNLHHRSVSRLFLSIGIPEKQLMLSAACCRSLPRLSHFSSPQSGSPDWVEGYDAATGFVFHEVMWFFVPGIACQLKGIAYRKAATGTGVLAPDAFSAISVDHELLCAAAKLWRRESVASNRLFCHSDRWRVAFICGRGRGWQALCLPQDFHGKFPDLHSAGETCIISFSTVLSGKARRWTDRRPLAQHAGTRILPPRGRPPVQRARSGLDAKPALVPRAFRIATAIFSIEPGGTGSDTFMRHGS